MSHYARGMTAIRDVECLVLALQEMGFKPEVHATPQHLIGYQGDTRPETAHVIIRRQQLTQASNDIGFVVTPTGIEAIVSEYDRRPQLFGEPWLKRVTQLAATHALIKAAQKRGRRVERTVVGGKQKVRVYA